MVSVAPLHRATQFDSIDAAAYAIPTLNQAVKVTSATGPSVFELLMSDQLGSNGSKNAATANESVPLIENSTGATESPSQTANARSGRELTMADVHTNRLGFNFVTAAITSEMNSSEFNLAEKAGQNSLVQGPGHIADPALNGITQGGLATELRILSSAVQQFLPQSMLELSGLVADQNATAMPSSQSLTDPQTSAVSESRVLRTSVSVPTSSEMERVRTAFEPAPASAVETQAIGNSNTLRTSGINYQGDGENSGRVVYQSAESPAFEIIANSKIAASETQFGQSQFSSDRLATTIVNVLGQSNSLGPASVSIPLNLAELGLVVLYLSLANGVVSIRIGVKKANTKRTLESQLKQLKESLAKRGVVCDQCQVEEEAEDQGSAQSGGETSESEAQKTTSPMLWNQTKPANDHPMTKSGHLDFVA